MKKRPRVLNKNKRLKAVARKRLGSPKPARVIDRNGPREKTKHKKRVGDNMILHAEDQ